MSKSARSIYAPEGIIQKNGPTYCKCCNYRVRTKPRSSYCKEKYHEEASKNVTEPPTESELNVIDEEQKLEKKSTPIHEILNSSKTYFELKEFIKNEIKPQANYQFVMLKHLLSRVSHKGKIAEDLALYNNKDPSNIEEVKKLMRGPVYDVLEKSGYVKKYLDSPIDEIPLSNSRNIIKYELDVDLDEFQLMQLDEMLQQKINEYNQEHYILFFDRKYEFPDIDWHEHKHLIQERISPELQQEPKIKEPIEQSTNYWLWSVTEENWPQVQSDNLWGSRVTNEQIETIVKLGDFIIFYVSGTKTIRGIFEVTSHWIDDSQNQTWSNEQESKQIIYKSKVSLRPTVLGTVHIDDLVDLTIFAGKTQNAKSKTLMGTNLGYPANNNRPVPKNDFESIKKLLTKSSVIEESKESREEPISILKECPKCHVKIEGLLSSTKLNKLNDQINEIFGYRQIDSNNSENKKPQSYCRQCRKSEKNITEQEKSELEQLKIFDLQEENVSIKQFELKETEFIKKGQNLTNDELVTKFGVGNMGGIRYSSKNNLLILCDTESGHYNDEIDKESEIIYYTGEGQTGDQTLSGKNQRIAESQNVPMFYFLEVPQEPDQNKRGAIGKIYRFIGKVRYLKHIIKIENDINGNSRKVIKFLLEVEK